MTTITVEIDKDKDLSALKTYLLKSGFKFEIDEQEDFQYTDDLKMMVNERYEGYKNGKVALISPEESQNQIHKLLSKDK